MSTYLMTFGGTEQGKNRHNDSYGIHRDYVREAQRLFSSAVYHGVENLLYYDNNWLKETKEYKENPEVFSAPSFGWAFKPVSIWYALNKINSGDALFWVDTNHVFMSNAQQIVDWAEKNNIFTHDHSPNFYPTGCFAFRDMFIGMGCDEERYWQCPQMQVNVMCFYKNDFVMEFVKQWKDFACDYDVMLANTHENFPCFYDHRHEQSIFSILVEKYKIPYYRGEPASMINEMMGIDVNE